MKQTAIGMLLTLGLLASFLSSSVFATSVASPPNSTDLIGVWIGYSEANGEFIRIELKPDLTGICALVPSPGTLGAQPSDVDVYPINRWHLNGWKLAIDLNLKNSKGEPIRLSGTFEGYGVHVEISSVKFKLKRTLLLRKESAVNGANLTAAEAIKNYQHQ